jgi:hypothetical protein
MSEMCHNQTCSLFGHTSESEVFCQHRNVLGSLIRRSCCNIRNPLRRIHLHRPQAGTSAGCGSLRMGPSGGGGRSRQGLRYRHGARRKSRRAAATVGSDDQAHRQPAGACPGRPRQPHGCRPVRAGEPDRGSQGRRRGLPGPAQAAVQRTLEMQMERPTGRSISLHRASRDAATI